MTRNTTWPEHADAPAPVTADAHSARAAAPDADRSPAQPEAARPAHVRCPQCGAENPVGAKVCRATPSCGSFLPRNQAARTTGIYARTLPEQIKQLRDDFIAGVTADLGGELTTLEDAYVQKLADIDTTVHLLTRDIAANGLLTPGGRVRDSYDKLLTGLAAFDRYAQRLGLARRAKHVDRLEAVRRAVEAATPDQGERQ